MPYPLRVRLYGGRATHAARDLNSGGHTTACDYSLSDDATNHWMPPTSTITCGRCLRTLRRTAPAAGEQQ